MPNSVPKYTLYVDAKQYESASGALSGSQVKELASIPATYQLYLEQEGDGRDRAVSDSDSIDLTGPEKHFFSVPPATFGAMLDEVDRQIGKLRTRLEASGSHVIASRLPSGAQLVEIHGYQLPIGWSRRTGTVIFVVPPSYPSAQPDSFWIEPRVRLSDNSTPINSSEANAIPELGEQRGTWFSWHMQEWKPNRDSLLTYVNAIKARLSPPR